MSYIQLSPTEWQWEDGGKHRAVRHFENQGTLVWSAWVERPDGPQFEDGISQRVSDFMERGAPVGSYAPEALVAVLRETFAMEAPTKPGSLMNWLRGRGARFVSSEPILPRKWALRAYGHHNVFAKSPQESARHVIMKAMLWALYLPQYPTMTVEVRIGDKYKPDLVAFDPKPSIYEADKPLFWGESGEVALAKIESLTRRFPNTHFAIAKWSTRLDPHVKIVRQALAELPRTVHRTAPFDVLCIPADSVARFIDADGTVTIQFDDLEWVRLEQPGASRG